MEKLMVAGIVALMIILSACAKPKDGKDGQSVVGPTGATGKSGTDGQDADPVTVVKLCPGTTVYPSTFVEVAFCIDHKLYGTYSVPGAFSTELPPGNYNSNAVGSSCNFTVADDCQVTQ